MQVSLIGFFYPRSEFQLQFTESGFYLALTPTLFSVPFEM